MATTSAPMSREAAALGSALVAEAQIKMGLLP
jgi:hypothetical protein